MDFARNLIQVHIVEPEILSSDARRIHVRLRRGVCQLWQLLQVKLPLQFFGGSFLELKTIWWHTLAKFGEHRYKGLQN
ncbi:hypothetical protein [Microcystis sp. M015S2]|uniref:hypothetical protein n=1 Tax=Microcystis sp. M015S2 TaxID=2771153 RepID=UPI00258C5E66|nr:hypothetical protein [Microcystis sp. M015S2]